MNRKAITDGVYDEEKIFDFYAHSYSRDDLYRLFLQRSDADFGNF